MTEVGNMAGVNQTVQTYFQDHLAEVDLNMDRIIENKTLTVETSEKKISENKEISEVGNEVTLGILVILVAVEVGQEIDKFQAILEEMREEEVGVGQVLGLVLIETEVDASDADSMIILPRVVETWQQQKRTSQIIHNKQWRQKTRTQQ